MRFGSRDPSKFLFLSDTSPKRIDREGLGERRTGDKQGKPEIQVGNSNGSRHFVWKASETCAVILDDAIFYSLNVSLADLERHLVAGQFSHDVKFNRLTFKQNISKSMICDGKHPEPVFFGRNAL